VTDVPGPDPSLRASLSRVRSILFVPGQRESWLAEAGQHAADAVVADLEDSVAPGQGEAARGAVSRFLAAGPGMTCLVRVHGAAQDAFADDVAAAVSPATSALVLPKVEEPDEVRRADAAISWRERETGLSAGRIGLVLLIESARAIVRLQCLIGASARVVGTMFAGADGGDLVRDLGAVWSLDPRSMLYARSRVLLESRASGLPLIMDGVFASVRDTEGFREDTLFGRSLGYTGRPAVHPSQVAVINEVYTPAEAEVREMRELLVTYERAVADGAGAVLFHGRMIDSAMAESARAVLARRAGRDPRGE
jgi:citrate lyase subunit beta / citryl-CoA lyase